MAAVNPYARDLRRQYNERFSIDSLNMTATEWVCRNTTLDGKPFSVKNYEFQRKIMDDMHPDMCCIKISQVGLTEVQLRKMLSFLKRNNGVNGVFTLADENMMERVSVSRLKPILTDDKVFTSAYDIANKSTRTKEITQIGRSFLYFAAAGESAATSIDADIVMNDEVDLSDQEMIGLISSRLQGSKWKIHHRFSTPTFPGFGVDGEYQMSDQHVFKCKCQSCGHWNDPQFNTNFIRGIKLPGDIEEFTDLTPTLIQEMIEGEHLKNAYVGCEKCGVVLDLVDPSWREWVATYPTKKHLRGYRVSVFSTGALGIPYIFTQMGKYYKRNAKRRFFNTVLGRAYSDDSTQLSRETLERGFTEQYLPPEVNWFDDYWIGIDVGLVCHIVIGKGYNCDEVVELLTCKGTDLEKTVSELLVKYPIRAGSIDRHPYTPDAHKIFKLSDGRIIPVEYRGSKDLRLVMDEFENLSHAQVERTSFIDNVVSKIRGGMKISGYKHNRETYIEHLRAMARVDEAEKVAVWTKLNDNDHYFHASAFMALGPQLAELVQLKSKAEMRTMVLSAVASPKEVTDGLPGVSNKRLDTLGSKE